MIFIMLQARDKGSPDRIRAHNLSENNQESDQWAAKRLLVSMYNGVNSPRVMRALRACC